MSRRFEFKKHDIPSVTVPIDIAGHKFGIQVTEQTAKDLIRFGKEAQEKAEKHDMDDAWQFTTGYIDRLLGAGATETIFAGREHNFLDALDIMTFIGEEITAAGKQMQMPKPVQPTAETAPDVQAMMRVMQNPEVMQAVMNAMKS